MYKASKPPVFKNFLYWYSSPNDKTGNKLPQPSSAFNIRKWLLEKGLTFEIITDGLGPDSRDVGELTHGLWSAFQEDATRAYYFFELEEDAVAFKLRWL